MFYRVKYANDFEMTNAQDITEDFIGISSLERKIDDDIMTARPIIFSTVKVDFIYQGTFKSIIDSIDASQLHIIQIEIKLPESKNWRIIFIGSIDPTSIEIEPISKKVFLSLRDKLASSFLFDVGFGRVKDIDLYADTNTDYDAGERLVLRVVDNECRLYVADVSDPYTIAESIRANPFSGGEILEYEEGSPGTRYTFLKWVEEKQDNNNHRYLKFTTEGDCVYDKKVFDLGDMAYSRFYFGEEPYLRYSSNYIYGIDAIKLIQILLNEVFPNETIIKDSSSADVGVSDFKRLTFDLIPDLTSHIKNLAQKGQLSLFIDILQRINIKKKYNYDSGTLRNFEDWHSNILTRKRSAYDIVRKYICRVDGNDGVTVTEEVENQYFNSGKDENIDIDYNGKTKDEEVLKNFAHSYADPLLDFYGKRREGIEFELIMLKDSYFDIDFYDKFEIDQTEYFIISMSYNFGKDLIKFKLIELEGQTS